MKAALSTLLPTFATILFFYFRFVTSLCAILFVGVTLWFGQHLKNARRPIEALSSMYAAAWLQSTRNGFWAIFYALLISWIWILWRVSFLTTKSKIFAVIFVLITQHALICFMMGGTSRCGLFIASMHTGHTAG